jgi:hypothetical protein
VAIRSSLKAQVHVVVAKEGIGVAAGDLFTATGRAELAAMTLDGAYRLRVDSQLEQDLDLENEPQRAPPSPPRSTAHPTRP